jgi:acyl-coenzyme A synthetase/AMP-(fatty) acid ligase
VSSLWDSLAGTDAAVAGALHSPEASVALAELAAASTLSASLASLRGRSILIATRDQLGAALALIELDGLARRMVLATPDVSRAHLEHVVAAAGIDAVAVDDGRAAEADLVQVAVRVAAPPAASAVDRRAREATEWVLLTSGTTGAPKLVLHSLESLAGALPRQDAAGSAIVWSTFYDIRRYGGLQIFLRAVLGGSPLVLSSPQEPVREFLARAAAAGVTHISGTPSHWRRALMSGAAQLIAPRYVRLSGEIADQAVLDALRAAYPGARISHAFASTEAGVAFDVTDGRAGFPAAMVGADAGSAALRVEDGTLRVRSARTASRYLDRGAEPLIDRDGFVDTGDMVELRDGRYYFIGRKGGIINVGGLKVHPEEVEAVINADPRVRMSLVRARRNPITGAVVVAEVVLADADAAGAAGAAADALKSELLDACRRALPAHKVPTMLRFVAALELTPAGKLVRPVA